MKTSMLSHSKLTLSPSASFAALLALLPLAACGNNGSGEAPPVPGTEAAATVAFWSDTPIGDAMEVRAARESAMDGDHVVLRGTLQEFGELSTFRLVDDALDDCTEMGEEDHCPTPWDYCCEDPDALAQFTVNVEFLEDGVPGDWSLEGKMGLDRLSEVVVAGVLRKDEAGNMRLEAERMALQPAQ